MSWRVIAAAPDQPPYALRYYDDREKGQQYDRYPAGPGQQLGAVRLYGSVEEASSRLAELRLYPAERASVYLAAQYQRRGELQGYIPLFEREGLTVTSRWLTTDQHFDVGAATAEEVAASPSKDRLDFMEQRHQRAIAEMDLADIERAQLVVAFTEPPGSAPTPRGGRHIEYGYALGLGRRVIICGHRESFFYMVDRPNVSFVEKPEAAARLAADLLHLAPALALR